MARVRAMIPVTELRQDAAAALVSIETYTAAEHEPELLRLLAKGDREVAGKGYDLDAVLAAADDLLSRK